MPRSISSNIHYDETMNTFVKMMTVIDVVALRFRSDTPQRLDLSSPKVLPRGALFSINLGVSDVIPVS